MEAPSRVCVVVPTYNERENVVRLVEEVKGWGIAGLALLFVDDSSPDGTGERVMEISRRDPWVKLMSRKVKLGIGSAYQDGFKQALATTQASVILEMDADLQHPPSSIPDLVRAVEEGADVAVGSRYVEGGSIVGWSFWRKMVSRGANAYARTMLGLPIRDATSGFRAYARRAAEAVSMADLPAKGFEFQVESLHLLKTSMKIVEVPYTFSIRASGVSKLRASDMARFFVSVLRFSL